MNLTQDILRMQEMSFLFRSSAMNAVTYLNSFFPFDFSWDDMKDLKEHPWFCHFDGTTCA